MTLDQLEAELQDSTLRGVTIFKSGEGWMVSARNSQGFRTHYGDELAETVSRTLAGGPQCLPGSAPDPDDIDDFGDLI